MESVVVLLSISILTSIEVFDGNCNLFSNVPYDFICALLINASEVLVIVCSESSKSFLGKTFSDPFV